MKTDYALVIMQDSPDEILLLGKCYPEPRISSVSFLKADVPVEAQRDSTHEYWEADRNYLEGVLEDEGGQVSPRAEVDLPFTEDVPVNTNSLLEDLVEAARLMTKHFDAGDGSTGGHHTLAIQVISRALSFNTTYDSDPHLLAIVKRGLHPDGSCYHNWIPSSICCTVCGNTRPAPAPPE